MRVTLTLFVFFNAFYLLGNFEVEKGNKPLWVHSIQEVESESTLQDGGYHYLLTDYQVHIPKQEVYRHIVVKLLNSDGVQYLSDVSMDYDPTYQRLVVHAIQIKRANEVIDKLKNAKIQTIQREGNLDRNMYDGAVTAMINLPDVRENDILEYAYTIINFNPVNEGNFSDQIYQEYYTPINRLYSRVVTNSDYPIRYQLKNGASTPKKVVRGLIKEYVWDQEIVLAKITDNNTPEWFDAKKHVLISTFSNWADVVNWVVPLYTSEDINIEDFDTRLIGVVGKEKRVSGIINWVQDDVRYLGFESGIGAYKPNSSPKVAHQRYGDCKDKSLLLVSLLRIEGIEAYPLLVNSYMKNKIGGLLPSNQVFNHCVVQYTLEDENYYVDPTYSNQGGDFETKQFPNYGMGLLIKDGVNQLLKIPPKGKGKVKIKEIFTVEESGNGNAKLFVRTSYYGNRADAIRDFFESNTQAIIKKEYLNFYSTIYPEISSTQDVKILDNSRTTLNEVFIEEYYEIENFWKKEETEGGSYGEFEPLVLNSLMNYPTTVKRTMPYGLGTPYFFSQVTEVVLPEEWQIAPDFTEIKGDGFVYRNKIEIKGNRLFITNVYDLTKSYIKADSVSKFLKQHEQINKGIAYQIMYTDEEEGFQVSWISICIVCLSLLIGVWVFMKVNREFDPVSESTQEGLAIGGWLILSGIGITISPLVFLKQVFVAEHFDETVWTALLNGSIENALEITLLFGLEIGYNFLFLIFTVFMVIQFYKKRSSFPKMILIYYGVALSMPILDSYLVSEYMMYDVEFMDPEVIKVSVQTFIAGVIWGLYYTMSTRVKNTFVNRYTP
ncbi:MAG: transglutaminase-like putative cysteine protease [Salibacteraceae bacterium]|jgi:transglutaminase-like putative cysteine protease